MAGEYLKSSVHVHSKLCDGKNTLDEIAVTAWRNGLQTLGFSGHSHTPCDLEYCMTQSRTALYKAQVAKLKERYAGKLDILCGLEWDLFSDDDPTQYDYWIGSTHYVKGPKTGKYYEIDWREEDLRACIDDDFDGDALAVVEAYFANVAKVAEKKPTILGHFDLIKKINGDGKFFDENDPRYTAAANAALMTAARNRCVLEVNTSAVYRGFRKDFFPSDAILKEWLVLSGNVVITADAHDTKALTFGFEAVAAKLKELGYALDTSMDAYIKAWYGWYCGSDDWYKESYTGMQGESCKRDRMSIRPAKRVAAEWASLLVTDDTEVSVEGAKANEWLQDWLDRANFWPTGQLIVEKAFAMGTAAWALWFDVRDDGAAVKVRRYDARMVRPLSWDEEGVSECAFVTRATVKGRRA